ncbi:MAG: DUF2334 domain-containing protein [Lachnospiraceae bacterium]|nr:DUF2334 domain-containing protein [Lachnospiraceae bacterium]
MKIAVRMDDITPDMDWKSFDAFVSLFRKYNFFPLLGIVPQNQDPKLTVDEADPDFYQKMINLQKEGFCLAMHGCNHLYATKKGGCFPLNPQSEFAGRQESEQRALLAKGKELLEKEGIYTDIFMAPGHTLDRTTVKILKELGFRCITDGFGTAPYKRWGMVWLPISFLRRFCFTDKEGITTLVIHANHSTKQQLDAYEKMFSENPDRFVSYSVFFEMEAKPQSLPARIKEYGLALGKQWAARAKRALRRG